MAGFEGESPEATDQRTLETIPKVRFYVFYVKYTRMHDGAGLTGGRPSVRLKDPANDVPGQLKTQRMPCRLNTLAYE